MTIHIGSTTTETSHTEWFGSAQPPLQPKSSSSPPAKRLLPSRPTGFLPFSLNLFIPSHTGNSISRKPAYLIRVRHNPVTPQ